MNRIYRIVFNRTLGVPQVVSELASAPGGAVGGTLTTPTMPGMKSRLLAVAVGLALMTTALPTFAQSCTPSATTLCGVSGGAGGAGVGGGYQGGAGGTGTGSGAYANGGGAGANSGTGSAGQGANGSGGAGGSAGTSGGAGAGGGVGTQGYGGGGGGGASFGSYGGGGGGGGGGVGQAVAGTTFVNPGSIFGGNGGNGGNGGFNGDSAYGGGGGGGGAGIYASAGSTITSAAGTTITGGNGGNGGGGFNAANGGGGGAGVAGVGFSLNSAGTINGGAGGNGGGQVSDGGSAGNGGMGGIGIAGTSLTLTNSGIVNGGAGGNGDSDTIRGGAGGYGGAAISITQSTLNNSGTITGGNGGSGGNGGYGSYGVGGTGGAGVAIAGAGSTVTNSGTINGGQGGAGPGGVGSGGFGVSISGNNNTLITSGSISGGLDGNGANPANAVDITGSSNTLELDSGYSFSGNVVSTAGNGNVLALGGATDDSFAVSAIGSTFTGFDSYLKSGSSTWTLTGTTTAVTPWTIDAGTLAISDDASLGATSDVLTLNGGALETTASLASSRNVALGALGGAINADTGTTATFSGVISDAVAGTAGSLAVNGPGTLILLGENTYTGGTTISNGAELLIGDQGTTGSIVGDVTNNGYLLFDRTDALTYDGVVSGNGGLYQYASGILTLTGASTYTGNTVIYGGTLALSGNGSIADAYNVVDYGTFDISNTSNGASITSLNGSGTVNLGAQSLTLSDAFDTFSGAISGSGGLTLSAGNETLTGTNTYTGDTAINSGTLAITSGGSVTSTGNVIDNGTLNVDGAGSAITAANGGTPFLVGSGGVGILTATNGATIGSNGEFNIGQSAGDTGTVTITSGSALNVADSINVGKYGNGSLTLSDGGTVNSSFLSIADQAGSTGNVTVTGAGSSVIVESGGQIVVGNHGGNGTLTIADGASVTGDSVSIAADAGSVGVLNIGAAAGSAATAAGTLDTGSVTFGAGTGTLVFNHTDTGYIFDPTISGNGTVDVLAGTTILTADNTYSGATTISGGTLALSGTGGIASSSDVIDNGTFDISSTSNGASIASLNGSGSVTLGTQTLTLTNANDTFNGVIAGSGALVVGAGQEVLDGVNTYTGATAVQGGTLLVGDSANPGASIAGDVSVANGAVLGGFGTVMGDVDVASGAHLAPGSGSTIGLFTIGGSLTLEQGSELDFAFGAPGANFSTAGTGDSVNVVGNLTLNGAVLNVNDAGGFGPGLYNLFSYGGSLTEANGGITLGTVPAGDALSIQSLTADKQINLINTSGTTLNFWNANGLASSTQMGGGSGTWSLTSSNWTDANGDVTAAMSPQPGFAIFGGAAGTVTVDDSAGTVSATGMQFMTSGYVMDGDTLTLVADSNGNAPVIRVGDGTTAGASDVATINNDLTGRKGLVKADYGTLVLAGKATFGGASAVTGGELDLDGNGSVFNGGITMSSGTTLLVGGAGASVRVAGSGGSDGSKYLNGGAGGNGTAGGTAISGSGFVLTNNSQIAGGAGGSGGEGKYHNGVSGNGGYAGAGGAGVSGSGFTLTNTGRIAGGQGGYGGSGGAGIANSSQVAGNGYSGGAGGAGGAGVNGSGFALTNTGTIAGGIGNGQGNGGTGAEGAYNASQLGGTGGVGGNGGAGGAGISGTQFSVTNSGAILGGNGGEGANGGTGGSGSTSSGIASVGGNGAGGNGGSGGAGGVAVSGSSFTLINSGSIAGGDGGMGGVGGAGGSNGTAPDGTAGVDGAGGAGGAGVVSTGDSIVINSGHIAGGLGADGTQADAVDFSGGNNTLEIDAGYSFTGNVVSTSGTTQGGDTLALGGSGNDSFNLGQVGAVGSAAAIQGFANFAKTGSSTWTLVGTGNASEAWTIADGTLAGNTTSLVGNVTFAPGAGDTAIVAFDQAQAGTYAGTLSGDGTLDKTGSSTLTLSGTNTYTGGTTITSGALQLGTGGTGGSIIGNVTNDGTLAFDHADDVTFAGIISGSGGLTQMGSGTLVLTGSSNYTGSTDVMAGTLDVEGSLASAVSVDNGATLVGTGSMGGMTIASGATVSPGGNGVVGTLTVNGNANLAAGSLYQLDATDSGNSDLIRATGTATLGGGSVISTEAGSNWNATTKYTILTAGSGVSGTFGSVSNNFAFLNPTLSYDANDVYLTLVRNATPFPSVGVTPNEIHTGAAVEALGAGNAVYNAVLPLAVGPARAAFNELAGDSLASTRTAIIDDSHYVRDAISNHLQGVQGANEIGQQADAQGSVWASTWGHGGNHDSDGNASSLSSTGSGLLVGTDKTLGDWRIGAVAGAGELSDSTDGAADAHSTSTVLGLYTGVNLGAWQFQGGTTHSWYETSSHRYFDVPGLGSVAAAKYDTGVTQAYVDGGYQFSFATGSATPFANLARVWLHQDAINEGGVAGLDVQANDTSVNYGTVGLRAAWAPNAWTQWYASAGYQHAWGDLASINQQRFANGGTDSFSVAGLPVAANAGIVDVGIRFPLGKNVTFDASYHGQFASQTKDQGARMVLNVAF
jgi:fibronectin-binding autotransporter adhesin